MPVHTPAERRKNRKSKTKKSNLAPPFEKAKTKKRARKSK